MGYRRDKDFRRCPDPKCKVERQEVRFQFVKSFGVVTCTPHEPTWHKCNRQKHKAQLRLTREHVVFSA